MTESEIKATVLRVLGNIAPESNLETLKPNVDFREQLDLDSMDYLNFVIALDEELHAGIPESAYTKFMSLDGCVNELRKLGI